MKFFLLSTLFTVCLTTSGQQIVQMNNCYRGSDVLEKRQVTFNSFGMNGTKGVWSLEEAEVSEDTYDDEYTTETDTLMAVERADRTYYSQDRDAVNIIGTENYMEQISYDMPETWLRFPMQRGDSICGYFNGTGKYCDRLFIRRFGTYLTKADAAGKLVLPEGDTLRNVIRLHTERYVGMVAAPIDTMKYKIPAFTVDSIVRRLATDSVRMREDVYRWYAEGYRYPILEAKTVIYGEEKLSEEMYYCPPEMQEQLAYDEENKQARTRLGTEEATPDVNGDTDHHDNFRYSISRDEGSGTITVSYSSESDVKVDALLANSLGYVYRRASRSDGSAITLSYSGLPRGQYIIHITAGQDHYAEKFHVR